MNTRWGLANPVGCMASAVGVTVPAMKLSARASVLAALVTLVACETTSWANGRFPEAQEVVVGPGAASDTVVLRATFGLVVSRDGGATFRWLCEDAMFAPDVVSGNTDPPIALLADGTIVWGYDYGLHGTQSGCAIIPAPTAGHGTLADLATDPADGVLLALEDNITGTDHVLRAAGGLSFATLGSGVTGTRMLTVEVAPSDAQRVYVSGRDAVTSGPVLYRSDDGGATLVAQHPNYGTIDDGPFISGVDPTAADVLYLRANVGFGSVLLRSADGGRSVTPVAQTSGPMLGFALSDDGATVWVGSPSDGLLRSEDHGLSFHTVGPTPTYCLRFHAGTLWQCGDWTHGYALARSGDLGQSFVPVLRFQDVVGAYDCSAAPTTAGAVCAAEWPAVQSTLAASVVPRHFDAGVDVAVTPVAMDAGMDAVADTLGGADVGTPASAVHPTSGCVCGTANENSGSFVGAVFAGMVLSLRRRPRSA